MSEVVGWRWPTGTSNEIPAGTAMAWPSGDTDWNKYPWCGIPPPEDTIMEMSRPPSGSETETMAPLVIWINSIFVGLGLVAVMLRCYSRLKILRFMYLEDHLASLSWIFSFLTSFFVCWATKHGIGLRYWNMIDFPFDANDIPATYLMTVLYTPAITLVKSSILLFYLRLTNAMDNGFRLWIKLIMAFIILCGTVFMGLIMFPCIKPVSAAWNIHNYTCETRCINQQSVFISGSALNVVSDFMIIAIPVKMLWGIPMVRRAKIQVSIVFGLGGLVCIMSCIRLVFVYKADPLIAKEDFLWLGAHSALWSAVEINVGIICACLPGIKPILARWWPTIFARIHPRNKPPSPVNGKFPSEMEDIPSFGGSGKPVRPPGYSFRSILRFGPSLMGSAANQSMAFPKRARTKGGYFRSYNIYRGDLDDSTREYDDTLSHPSQNISMGCTGAVQVGSEEQIVGPTSCFGDLEIGLYSGIDRSGDKAEQSIKKTTEARPPANAAGPSSVAAVRKKDNGGMLFTWPGTKK